MIVSTSAKICRETTN